MYRCDLNNPSHYLETMNKTYDIYLGLVTNTGSDLITDMGEDLVVETLVRLLRNEFGIDGATITPAIGVWKGDTEPVAVITLLGDSVTFPIERICDTLRDAFQQDCVAYREAAPLTFV